MHSPVLMYSGTCTTRPVDKVAGLDTVEMSQYGEIVIDDKCHTSEPGIFAAGDVTTVPYKQIVISMGEGAKASLAAFEYLLSHEVVETEEESVAA